jgi:hypothetical protein
LHADLIFVPFFFLFHPFLPMCGDGCAPLLLMLILLLRRAPDAKDSSKRAAVLPYMVLVLVGAAIFPVWSA